MKNNITPYWRLSGFYFFYFASLGALIPYWSVYLKSLGFNYAEIGELFAILIATKVIAPNIWGWIADHKGKRMMIVRLGSLLAMIAFIGVFFVTSYWGIALAMIVFSFFWNAVLPQFEATTMTHMQDEPHKYSSIRLWGSVGFIVAVAALAPVLEKYGAGLLPTFLFILIAGIWLMSLTVPERAAGHLHISHERLRSILVRPEVAGLLIASFLMQASHGPYYTFYTVYMEDSGYSRTLVGQLWALGVLAEIGIFMLMHRLVPLFGLRNLLLASFIFTSARWILIGGFVDMLGIMILAQILHAASFGIFHACTIQLIHRFFKGKHQGKGQALYSSFSFGAGGAVGSLYGGYVGESMGPEYAYFISAIICVVAFAISWRMIKVEQPTQV
ncbi:MAG: MFS transporter [Gammaproteobacteria bacterium]|nr:MFS transporter [Gammaproteobacteria bacterium]